MPSPCDGPRQRARRAADSPTRAPPPTTRAPTNARAGDRAHPARDAHASGSLGFGFSGGGFLFPYFIGVADALVTFGVIGPTTPVAGASAGSLIAAAVAAGIPTGRLVQAMLDLAHRCREIGRAHV